MSGVNHLAIPEKAELSVTRCHTSQQIDADDNLIVEKPVLVLKFEKPSLTTLPSSEGKAQVWSQQPNNGVKGEKSNTTSLPAPLHASISSNDGIDKSSISCRSKQSGHNGMRIVNSEKDPPVSANITVAENPYQAPYASVSSSEDQYTRKTEYGKATLDSTETSSRAEETFQTLVPHVKTAKTVQPEKVSVKKSPKGFRRLLKFGKKNHTSLVDQSIDSECTSTRAVEQEDIAHKMASTSEL